MANFWSVLWTVFFIFLFVAYLMVLFSVLADIFRDGSMRGAAKAGWVFFLIFFPFLTLLIYLFARGDGMAMRQQQAVADARKQTDAYIRDVAGTSATAEIERAKALLDSGAITKAEFATLKAQALK